MRKPIKFISKVSKQSKELFIELLFPRFCVGCGEESEWLCSKCSKDIIAVVSQVCPKCGKLSSGGQYHDECKKGIALKGIIAAAYFEEGPVREMIHNFKYNGVTELAKPLAEMMGKTLKEKLGVGSLELVRNQDSSFQLQTPILTFAPLHWRRQATRGYNQSQLLAREISSKLNIPMVDALKKIKKTERQVALKGDKRRENLKGLFRLKNNINIKKKTIIIIDDVYTTGSTLNECARVLKKAGAKEVWGLVIARG